MTEPWAATAFLRRVGGLRIVGGRAPGRIRAGRCRGRRHLDRSLAGKAPAARTRRHDAHAVAGGQAEAPDLRGERARARPAGIQDDGAAAPGLATVEPPGREARPVERAEEARLVAEHLDG